MRATRTPRTGQRKGSPNIRNQRRGSHMELCVHHARPMRFRLPRRTGRLCQASRVAASNSSSVYLPSLNSAIPAAYSVSPDRSVCGNRALSRHFCTAEGRIPNRFPSFVSPIWSIALATALLMCPSLHRKWKMTIDRECKRLVSHFRHGESPTRDVLGQARGSQSGRRLALWSIGYRARTRCLAVSGSEVAGWHWFAGAKEHDCPRHTSRRQYRMAENGPRPEAV